MDLGRRDIATTSTGSAWNGKQLQDVRHRYSKVRANVQRKCTWSSRRLLRRLSGRESRFQSWVNHNISRKLVDDALTASAALAFEDLTNISLLSLWRDKSRSQANECFRVVFGWSFDEIVGQPLTAIIPNSFHDAHNLGFSRFAMTEKSRVLNHPLQLKAVTKDGREIDMEHFIIAEQQQGEWMFKATLRPLDTH